MVRLLSEPEVEAEMTIAEELCEDVSEAAARTIASWYQSSGTIGSKLAAFASGAPVSMREVYEDTERTARQLSNWTRELQHLATYALNSK